MKFNHTIEVVCACLEAGMRRGREAGRPAPHCGSIAACGAAGNMAAVVSEVGAREAAPGCVCPVLLCLHDGVRRNILVRTSSIHAGDL